MRGKIKPHNVVQMFFKLIDTCRGELLKPITVYIIPEEYRPLYFYYRERVYDKKFVIEFSPPFNILGEIIGAMSAVSAAGIPILMTNLTYARILTKYKLAKAIVYLSDLQKQKEEFILGKTGKIFRVDREMIKTIKWICSVLAFSVPHGELFRVILWLVNP